MNDNLAFLERLGLDPQAALPAIRRAYARELKLIDQEHDAAGFQLLRDAYETAVHWFKSRADPLVPGPALVAPAALPALAIFPDKVASQVDPDALAQDVYMRFMSVLSDRGAGLDSCAALLAQALDEPALLNLSARTRFEGRLVRLLAAGWQPGHEVLLVAAVEVFGWDGDYRRLCDFGAAGEVLWQAIDERYMFDEQPSDDVIGQRRVVARLRSKAPPSRQELLRDMRHLQALVARFPTWLALVTNVDGIDRWRELDGDIPQWRRVLAFERELKESAEWRGDSVANYGLLMIVLLMMALHVARMVGQDPAPEAAPEVAYAAPRTVVQADTRSMTVAEVLAEVEKLPKGYTVQVSSAAFVLEIKEVNDALQFEPAAAQRGQLRVAHQLELDAFGRLARLTLTQASAEPAFDEAAEAAIRGHGHWGGESPRLFVLVHSR